MTQITNNKHDIETVVENLLNEGFDISTMGSVVILVKNKEGKYLVLQRSWEDEDGPGLYDFAGGSTDTNDDPSGDADRELFEETGITASSLDLIHHGKYICPWKGEEKVKFVFACETDEEVKLSFEHHSFEWVDASEIMNYEFYKVGLQELLLEHAKQD